MRRMPPHPTGHHGAGHHGAGHKQGGRGAPLDKRLNAASGKEETSMSQWNMAELKANLEDDSAMLEQTLRNANKLLGDTSGVQLVDVGGLVGEDGKRMLRENANGNSVADAELARIKSGTWLTELTTKGVGREPQVELPFGRLARTKYVRFLCVGGGRSLPLPPSWPLAPCCECACAAAFLSIP